VPIRLQAWNHCDRAGRRGRLGQLPTPRSARSARRGERCKVDLPDQQRHHRPVHRRHPAALSIRLVPGGWPGQCDARRSPARRGACWPRCPP